MATDVSDFEAPADFGTITAEVPKDEPVRAYRGATEAVAEAEPADDTIEQSDSGDEGDVAEVRDRNGRFRRHRSEKNRATPADVPRIRELAAKVKASEAEKADLRARLEALEARPVAREPEKPKETSGEFTEAKPTIQSLIDAGVADPYAELPDAVLDWREKKAAHQKSIEDAKAKETSAAAKQDEKELQAHWGREKSFRESHSDYDSVLKQADADAGRNLVTPILQRAILTDDNGPAFMYHLAQHPDALMDAFLATRGQTADEDAVAVWRRKLSLAITREQAGARTGSVAAPDAYRAPRPPNPVRTSPTPPTDDATSLPEDADLDTHMRVMSRLRDKEGWGRRGRR